MFRVTPFRTLCHDKDQPSGSFSRPGNHQGPASRQARSAMPWRGRQGTPGGEWGAL